MGQIVIIVQARMGATRLPGKPLKLVLGKPLLGYLMDRLKRVKRADQLVVATTQNPQDQKIVDWCTAAGLTVFKGSEEDVLDRYYQTAKEAGAEVVVRVTGDCPLIDPEIVDRVIELFLSGNYDYVSNVLERTFPRGMDVEVFSFKALEKAALEAKAPEEREHVTPFIYRHPELFRLGNLKGKKNDSKFRLTVDTKEDLMVVSLLIEALYPKKQNFTLEDLLGALQENPEWEKINSHIEQKPFCECND
jgi:spore coat polysaccharide biosynthesis protein SpsF